MVSAKSFALSLVLFFASTACGKAVNDYTCGGNTDLCCSDCPGGNFCEDIPAGGGGTTGFLRCRLGERPRCTYPDGSPDAMPCKNNKNPYLIGIPRDIGPQAGHGQCGIHIQQFQKHEKRWGNSDKYQVSVTLFDGTGQQFPFRIPTVGRDEDYSMARNFYPTVNMMAVEDGVNTTFSKDDTKFFEDVTIKVGPLDSDVLELYIGEGDSARYWSTSGLHDDKPILGGWLQKPDWNKEGDSPWGYSGGSRQTDLGFDC